MSRRLLIYEPSHEGHHLHYVRLIVESAQRFGWESVLATTPLGQSSPQMAETLGETGLSIHLLEGKRPHICTVRDVSRAVQAVNADAVIVPNADVFVVALSLSRRASIRVPCVALVMRGLDGVATRNLRSRLVLAAKGWAVRRVSATPIVSVLMLGTAIAQGGDTAVVSDPLLLDRVSTGWRPDLDPDRYWFALVGVIDRWKNPILVIRALASTRTRQRIGLVIIGPIAESLRGGILAEVSALPESVEVIIEDRVLTNAEFNEVVACADAVVMAYSTHAPNSTAAKAAALGTRVIGAGSSAYVNKVQAVAPSALLADLNAESLSSAMGLAVTLPAPATVFDFPPASTFGDTFLREVERLTDVAEEQ